MMILLNKKNYMISINFRYNQKKLKKLCQNQLDIIMINGF